MRPELKQYFKLSPDKKYLIFIGEQMDVLINERYEGRGCLALENGVVRTLGIFDATINETIEFGVLIPAIIRMQPTLTEKVADGKYTYLKATFYKGDVFCATSVVRNPQFSYVMYYEFIYIGAQPKFLNYETIFTLFDVAQEVTGSNFKVAHTVFEVLYSYPYRSQKDIRTQYRLSDKKQPPVFVPLREVAHITSSTTSKLVGSYFSNAIDAALINEADQPTELEELLRQ
jgi:hypothetical protein